MDPRVQKLLNQGAVPLGDMPSVRIGTYETGIKFHFVCPICNNRVSNDQEMEPMCTGPNWTNDHEPAVMRQVK